MQENPNPQPVKPELIIFDLDGTLYDQVQLRKLLMRELLSLLITFRISFTDFRIIRCFRKQREQKKGYSSDHLMEEQYEWCAAIMHLTPGRVRKCIETWMYQFPLPFLKPMKFKGTDEFFALLREMQVKIVIYSDFPVKEKLNALELSADAHFCSTQSAINQFKPGIRAIQYICGEMQCAPEKTWFIGDREDTDGESARMAGIHFIHVDRRKALKGIFYSTLAEQFRTNYG